MSVDAARGDLTASIWLFLLKSGGHWWSLEVAHAIGRDAHTVSQLLSAMHREGKVRHYAQKTARRFKYGVTGDCKTPRAVTVAQIAECLADQPEEVAA